jgi:hypothetical protein
MMTKELLLSDVIQPRLESSFRLLPRMLTIYISAPAEVLVDQFVQVTLGEVWTPFGLPSRPGVRHLLIGDAEFSILPMSATAC